MDMKEKYQSMAEEMAREQYRMDFYSLPDYLQYEVYNKAIVEVNDQIGWRDTR